MYLQIRQETLLDMYMYLVLYSMFLMLHRLKIQPVDVKWMCQLTI